MTNPVNPPPLPQNYEDLLKGIGKKPTKGDLANVWPVPTLIHPGLTCLLGQPERGKTRLLMSLALALTTGSKWLGQPTYLDPTKRILFFCEESTSLAAAEELLTNAGDRIELLLPSHWGLDVPLARLVNDASVGVIIVDGVFPIVGDVNEQARADAFLSALRDAAVPSVVAHHEAKGGGGTPVGVQAFGAAYRHTIRATACKSLGGGRMQVDLAVSGNDVAGMSKMTVLIHRQSLATSVGAFEASEPEADSAASPRKRRKRVSPTDRTRSLAQYAKCQGLSLDPNLSATDYATRLLGGARGHEDPDRQEAVKVALGGASARHQSVSNLIRDNRRIYDEVIGG